jgi:tryptophan-rich sensory protein
MKLNQIIIIGVVILLSFAGGQFTSSGMDWYRTIKLPEWTPPGSVIGIVWTTIYILTAASAIIAWRVFAGDSRFYLVAGLFIMNAAFNLAWSYIFFARRMIGPAVIDSIAIEITLLLLMPVLWKKSRAASVLLLPYALWVAFATYLNYCIYALNKT